MSIRRRSSKTTSLRPLTCQNPVSQGETSSRAVCHSRYVSGPFDVGEANDTGVKLCTFVSYG
jgi:hypothetical protein